MSDAGKTSILVTAGPEQRATVVAVQPDGLAAPAVYIEPGKSKSFAVQHADGAKTTLEVSVAVVGKSPKTA